MPGHNTPVTTNLYYDATGTGQDYTHADSNSTFKVLPSGCKIKNIYDENYRKLSVTASAADGVTDAATASYSYDGEGNITSGKAPNEQTGQTFASLNTQYAYDERNRVMSLTDPLLKTTSIKYDGAGRKARVTRPNSQVISYESYDVMNRLLQQTVQQAPNPDATTKYTYYASGLLHTMQDPKLGAAGSASAYTYTYDNLGRKTRLDYPPASDPGTGPNEQWQYDTSGRLGVYTTRAGNTQTFSYDALNRPTGFVWSDNPTTPNVSFSYDVASHLMSVVNANATVARTYFNDNSIKTEIVTAGDNVPRAITYAYNSDGLRQTLTYPANAYSFTYDYTGRNQLKSVANTATPNSPIASFTYADPNGNLTGRTLDNSTSSSYSYDSRDSVMSVSHALTSGTRSFTYAYDDVGNRQWMKRESGLGDVYGYDLADQVDAVQLNVSNPDTTAIGAQTISYDQNGNRTTFAPPGYNESYATNNLNQYTARNGNSFGYDTNGNLTSFAGWNAPFNAQSWTYSYDSQNRLLGAVNSTMSMSFKYDGLNRQVSRTLNAGVPTYSVYDSWSLVAEYQSGSLTGSYVYGATGVVKNLVNNRYYYQDGSGSTSHLASSTGTLVEWYRYDLHGKPTFYDGSGLSIGASANNVRHLFTGQQWSSDIGLYDLRNRFYSPDLGRFAQSDPIGFSGDPSNLFRYASNNPVSFADPTGLVIVNGDPVPAGQGPGLGDQVRDGLQHWIRLKIDAGGFGGFGGALGGAQGSQVLSGDTPGFNFTLGGDLPTLDVAPVGLGAGPGSPTALDYVVGAVDALSMLNDFLIGLGANAAFGQNSAEAALMSGSPAVQNAMNNFWYANRGISDPSQMTPVTYQSNFGTSGLKEAGVNMTQQFIGSSTVTVTPLVSNAVSVNVWNRTSVWSGAYHQLPLAYDRPSWAPPVPGANAYQSISFVMPIP